MSIEFSVLLAVFAVVFVLELPDKTMVATLVLSSRYRPLPVLVGVSGAFAIHMGLAVTIGHSLTLLPKELTLSAIAILFIIGAFLLIRESLHNDDDSPEQTPTATSAWRIALISFGVLLVAELGDGSQLATAALSARYAAPLSVFLGAWLAEVSVCTIAAFTGRALLRLMPVKWIQRIAATIFIAFSMIALIELAREIT